VVLVSGLGVNGSNGHIGADAFEPNDLSWAVGRRIPPTGAAVDLHALLVLGSVDISREKWDNSLFYRKKPNKEEIPCAMLICPMQIGL